MMSTKTGRRERLRDTLNFHRFALSTEAFERRQSLASDVFLQGMAFVDVNNNSVLHAGEWYLANATIKLFDWIGRPSSVRRPPTPWDSICSKDGNGTVFNDDLTAGTDQHLEVPPKKTLRPKDRAPQTLVHRPSTLGHRLTRFGIVIH